MPYNESAPAYKMAHDASNLVNYGLFKQKTAYEMLRSLVGSEMCIRDSFSALHQTLRY